MLRELRRVAGKLKRWVFPPPDWFLASCKGVIHVGAHVGQERSLYASHNLAVVWIEPQPEQFAILQSNIRDFDKQIAINALLTDEDGKRYIFHVSNNDGLSSSILQLHLHKVVCPTVHYTHDIEMTSTTLPTVLEKHGINLSDYDALVLDTQASELTILRGAKAILRSFKFIKLEAADFELYQNCPTMTDIREFMRSVGFRLYQKIKFAEHKQVGACFDLVFKHR